MMVAMAQGTAWVDSCTFCDIMAMCTTIAALLLMMMTLRSTMPIVIALVALCDIQMWEIAFDRVALVVDIEAEFDACVGSLGVFSENDDGMAQR